MPLVLFSRPMQKYELSVKKFSIKNHCDWTVLDKFVFARQWITAEACLGAHTGSTPEFYLFVTTIKPLQFRTHQMLLAVTISIKFCLI